MGARPDWIRHHHHHHHHDALEFFSGHRPGEDMDAIKLTSLSQAGGCGCKIEPAVLNELLSKIPKTCNPPNLLSASRPVTMPPSCGSANTSR
jgi:hypothetical protein